METSDEKGSDKHRYERLSKEQKTKLNRYLELLIAKTSIDYTNAEFKDMQSAVKEFLDRIARKVNERGNIQIKRVQSCGSMGENTGVWKLQVEANEVYTEFDFLAMLEGSVDTESISHLCCLPVRSKAINAQYLNTLSRELNFQIRGGYFPSKNIHRMFLIELYKSLNTVCGCCQANLESVCYGNTTLEGRLIITFTNAPDARCTECCVDTPSGILSIDTSKKVEFKYVKSPKENKQNKCSIILLWNSKAKSSFPLAHSQHALPIYIDLVPALESEPAVDGTQHVVVSKSCSVDRYHGDWRRSTHYPKLYNMAHLLALNVLLLPKDLTIIFIIMQKLNTYSNTCLKST